MFSAAGSQSAFSPKNGPAPARLRTYPPCPRPKKCWPITGPPGCRCGAIRWSFSARNWRPWQARRPPNWNAGPTASRSAVAGIVLVRQRPSTAKGITFVTLEDETDTANLIVRPAVWLRYRRAAGGATILLARGILQRQGEIIHLLVSRLENLSGRLQALEAQSRDFR